MKNREQFDTYMRDFVDALEGDKKLLIVSSGKSTLAYETCAMLAEQANMHVEIGMLRCEDGELHEMAFIGGHVCKTLSHARAGIDLVFDCKEGRISRSRLQFELGELLGYSLDDILDFVASAMARTCPCDCCGGPFVDEKLFDSETPHLGYTTVDGKHGVNLLKSS